MSLTSVYNKRKSGNESFLKSLIELVDDGIGDPAEENLRSTSFETGNSIALVPHTENVTVIQCEAADVGAQSLIVQSQTDKPNGKDDIIEARQKLDSGDFTEDLVKMLSNADITEGQIPITTARLEVLNYIAEVCIEKGLETPEALQQIRNLLAFTSSSPNHRDRKERGSGLKYFEEAFAKVSFVRGDSASLLPTETSEMHISTEHPV